MTNRAWHDAHRMPRNATLEQRIEWHLEHAVACRCREIPEGVKKALSDRNIPIPPRKRA